jgi:hypothetical protein
MEGGGTVFNASYYIPFPLRLAYINQCDWLVAGEDYEYQHPSE